MKKSNIISFIFMRRVNMRVDDCSCFTIRKPCLVPLLAYFKPSQLLQRNSVTGCRIDDSYNSRLKRLVYRDRSDYSRGRRSLQRETAKVTSWLAVKSRFEISFRANRMFAEKWQYSIEINDKFMPGEGTIY